MKFVYILIGLCIFLQAEDKNPFDLSNIHKIDANIQQFLIEFDTVKKKIKENKKIHLLRDLEKEKIVKKDKVSKFRLLKKTQSNDKIIYLTFDDGPLHGTENVIRILLEEEINATMFFVGKHIQKNKILFHKALSMQNLCISNHTYSHANEKYAYFYSNLNRVIHDVDKSQQIIGGEKYLRLAGRNIWRLPEISKNDYAISKRQRNIEIPKYDTLMNRGYQIYGWDVEWNFNHHTGKPSYGVETILKKIESKYKQGDMTKKGKIILLSHDYMFRGEEGADKLRLLIHKLKENNWRFESLKRYAKSQLDIVI